MKTDKPKTDTRGNITIGVILIMIALTLVFVHRSDIAAVKRHNLQMYSDCMTQADNRAQCDNEEGVRAVRKLACEGRGGSIDKHGDCSWD